MIRGGGWELKSREYEFDEEMTNSIFTDKDNCAYCCQASYYKGISPGKLGKGQRTHIIERVKE